MKILLSIIFALTLAFATFAQDKRPTIWSVETVAGKTATVTGSLKDGAQLTDYSWAWNSANACFPATQKAKFTGNHVFFMTKLPPRSILTVTVRPKDKSKNLSIYGYQIAPDKNTLPENLQSCVTCEAEHKWDYPKRGRTQDESRSITFNATTNSYNIIIGVTGADGLTEADFTVAFTLKQ
jgi:hypothetical protein